MHGCAATLSVLLVQSQYQAASLHHRCPIASTPCLLRHDDDLAHRRCRLSTKLHSPTLPAGSNQCSFVTHLWHTHCTLSQSMQHDSFTAMTWGHCCCLYLWAVAVTFGAATFQLLNAYMAHAPQPALPKAVCMW